MPGWVPSKFTGRYRGSVNTNQNFTLAEFRHRYVLEDHPLTAGRTVESNGVHRVKLPRMNLRSLNLVAACKFVVAAGAGVWSPSVVDLALSVVF
jgi:hypothetical protein